MFDNVFVGEGMSSRDQPPHVLRRRAVLNTHWPPDAASFRDHDPLPVTARVVFDGDGEVFLRGEALRWDGAHVYVRVDDRRCEGNGVWLKPDDVYRRAPE